MQYGEVVDLNEVRTAAQKPQAPAPRRQVRVLDYINYAIDNIEYRIDLPRYGRGHIRPHLTVVTEPTV